MFLIPYFYALLLLQKAPCTWDGNISVTLLQIHSDIVITDISELWLECNPDKKHLEICLKYTRLLP